LITANVIHRTFHIQVGDSVGTCFTIDVNGKQYLVTAKHVVKDLNDTCIIKVFHENQWKDIQVTVVGHCDDGIDISVLAAQQQLSPTLSLEPTSDGMVYGQDVYFLGFPYGMTGDVGALNREFPLPFVKKAIISCLHTTGDGVHITFLDGHNNPGFSGGPVVFKKPNQTEFKVTSVISGFKYTEEPIYQGGDEVPLAYKYNTGIIISYGIEHAIDVIEANPVGYELQA